MPWVTGGPHHGGDADDATIALLHHGAHHGATHSKHRFQVGVHHRIPFVVLHAHGQVVARDTGVVHQHLQPAMLFDNIANHGFGSLRIIDVQGCLLYTSD